jgi:hypothetical protein
MGATSTTGMESYLTLIIAFAGKRIDDLFDEA